MSVSDIITLVSLVLAIVAVIGEKNRRHQLLKFGWLDYVLLLIAFLLINYFTFYPSFYRRGWYFEQLYVGSSSYWWKMAFANPKNWAYLSALFSLFFLIFKLYKGFFPASKTQEVLAFYRQQLENLEISLLLDLIEEHHLGDIKDYLARSKDVPVFADYRGMLEGNLEQASFRMRWKRKLYYGNRKFWRQLWPSSNANRDAYANNVLFEIISHPIFLEKASVLRPYFFVNFLSLFSIAKRGSYPSEVFGSFYGQLIGSNNFWLKRELRNSDEINSYDLPEGFFEKNKLLATCVGDLSVADRHNIWQPFGDEASSEIEAERLLGGQSDLLKEFVNEEQLWKFKTRLTIQFLHVIYMRSIHDEYSGSHFWIHYFSSLSSRLAKVLDGGLSDYSDYKKPTVAHEMIELMISDLFDLLRQANLVGRGKRHWDIVACLGATLGYLIPSAGYGHKKVVKLIVRFFESYCNLEENDETSDIRAAFEKELVSPNMLTDNSLAPLYTSLLVEAWDDFDKYPVRGLGSFERLQEKVIIPLGLPADSS